MPKKTGPVYSLASTPETPFLLASCADSLQTLFELVWFAEYKKQWTSSPAQRMKLADMMKKTTGMYVPVPKKKIAEWSPATVLHFLCAPALASFVGKQLGSHIVYANNDFLKLSAKDGAHAEIARVLCDFGVCALWCLAAGGRGDRFGRRVCKHGQRGGTGLHFAFLLRAHGDYFAGVVDARGIACA